MLNTSCRTILIALAGVAVAAAISILPGNACAQNSTSISTLRETIESAHVGAAGTNAVATVKPYGRVTLRKQGTKQMFDVDVRSLSSSLSSSNTGWGVWLDLNSTFQTNDLVSLLSQLDRLVSTGEHYTATMEAVNAAPQFLSVTVPDLNDLTNHVICIGTPTGIGTTNVVVDCVLWAPIPALVPAPARTSFNTYAPLALPVLPVINGQLWVPAPKARGKIHLRYSGSTGQSFIEVDARNLLGGHTYSVWMTLTTVDDSAYPACITNNVSSCLTNIDQLTLSFSGMAGQYVRDTKVGDSLPLQFKYADDLSNHLLLIEDEDNLIYLQGVIP
jgi:hypothetical protein